MLCNWLLACCTVILQSGDYYLACQKDLFWFQQKHPVHLFGWWTVFIYSDDTLFCFPAGGKGFVGGVDQRPTMLLTDLLWHKHDRWDLQSGLLRFFKHLDLTLLKGVEWMVAVRDLEIGLTLTLWCRRLRIKSLFDVLFSETWLTLEESTSLFLCWYTSCPRCLPCSLSLPHGDENALGG